MYFERLAVWKRAAQLSADLYIYFRDCRDWGFKDQVTRSGLSIPSNIAEGMTRTGTIEKMRFLNIAYSSCAELRTQIHIGNKVGFIEPNTAKNWVKETEEISSMLKGLEKSLKTQS